MTEDRADYWTWRHAVGFGRSLNQADDLFAEELLAEWGEARGLKLVATRTREADFRAVAFYAGLYTGEKTAPKKATRLTIEGRPRGETLEGREEYYPSEPAS